MTPARKLGLLATLYFSQGLPFGLFTQALPVLLRKQDMALSSIGLTSLLAAPWALKFLWAPLVDRFGSERVGRKKSWIVPLQLAAATLLGLIALGSGEALTWLLVAVFLTNLIAATQDIATDALAVEMLDYRERGLGNGVQVAGYRVGMIVGGGALLVALEQLGWSLTLSTAAVLLFAATLPILHHREAPSPRPAAPPCEPAARRWPVLELLSRPGMKPWLVVLLTYKTGDALGTGMLRPFLVDLGLGLGDIGWLLGTVGFAAGLLGALLGGWAVTWLGRRRALLGFGGFQMVAVASYAIPASGFAPVPLLYVLGAIEHVAGGMATAALFTSMMDRSRTESAANDYTLQACVVVIATGVATAVSGFVAEALGYAMHFALSGIVCALGLALAWWLVPSARLLQAPQTRGVA